ncbi:MAG: hypothetical protein PF693_01015 [Spirochaetia bacterium]|jgi:hypothetical protein|nr:hypothetical protein [Spirochaetia bacterium]
MSVDYPEMQSLSDSLINVFNHERQNMSKELYKNARNHLTALKATISRLQKESNRSEYRERGYATYAGLDRQIGEVEDYGCYVDEM